MNNNRLFPILGGIGLIVLLLFIVFGANRSKYNWKEHYKKEKVDPYGLFIADQLLHQLFPNQKVHEITDSLSGSLVNNLRQNVANYVFIGSGMYLNDNDTGELLDFVDAGNNALISSQSLPYQLAEYLEFEWCDDANYEDYYSYEWTDYDYVYDTIAQVNFTHPDLEQTTGYELKYRYKEDVKARPWSYLDGNFMCEDTIAMLGLLNDSLANFVRVPYGEGYFYLHSSPLAFTNLYLLREEYLNYFNGVFEHLSEGDIYMDYVSHVPLEVARRNNQDYNAGDKKLTTEHPMKYILSQPSLRWAWYLLLALALLYVLFRAKRRQRIIPVLPPNENSSLEFIQTIGRLNFLKNNHRQVVLQQMKLWQNYVRERYHILPKSEDFVPKLATKAKFPIEHLEKILLIHRNVQASTYASENILAEFHGLLEHFYQNEKNS